MPQTAPPPSSVRGRPARKRPGTRSKVMRPLGRRSEEIRAIQRLWVVQCEHAKARGIYDPGMA